MTHFFQSDEASQYKKDADLDSENEMLLFFSKFLEKN